MIRSATALTILTLLAAGCGRSEPQKPSPAEVPADDIIAAMEEAQPGSPAIAPVTMAPPRRTIGHAVPKDHVKNALTKKAGGEAKPASADESKPAAGEAPAADAPSPGAPTAEGDHAGHDHAGHDHAGHDHDPANPPIDCPLAKAGVDAHHMKPFEDVEKYIAFLERPDRAEWQKPDEVVAALELQGNETLYDIGAGSGYFSFRFAKALPKGKVIAADTEAEMVRHVHHKTMTEGIENVTAKVIGVDDPGVTDDVDLVFICDVLHHVQDRPAWMKKLAEEMQVGARLVIIEFREGELPKGPPPEMKISRAETVKLATDAGFQMVSENGDLLPYQRLFVFEKPAP